MALRRLFPSSNIDCKGPAFGRDSAGGCPALGCCDEGSGAGDAVTLGTVTGGAGGATACCGRTCPCFIRRMASTAEIAPSIPSTLLSRR